MKAFVLTIPVPSPESLAGLVQEAPPAFWLDSASLHHPHSQVSIFALDPRAQQFAENFEDFLKFASETDAALPMQATASAGTFGGGWIGCLSYEGQAHFFLFDTWLEIDHSRGEARVFSWGLKEGFAETDLALAEQRARNLAGRLEISPKTFRPWQVQLLRAESSREIYLSQVRDIQNRLRRGDCYQVNLSQAYSATGEGDAAQLYLRLRQTAPAPQMAFVNLGEEQIFSASPEILLETEGSRARSYPIKGTRPRASDPEADARLARELLASPKDAAELLMIVDLVRNDLGAVSVAGSVRVRELKRLESLPQVHHLYAIVESDLKAGIGPLQALHRLSPGGSITGAPKLKAMEVIAELEKKPRGIYTGSIGYAGFSGRSSFNIAIRTAVLKNGKLEYRAGGGIVVDSEPEAEYEECRHKARGFFAALGAEPDRD